MRWPPVAFLGGLALVATATTAVLVGRSHHDQPIRTVPLRPDVAERLATPQPSTTAPWPTPPRIPVTGPSTAARPVARPVRLTIPALHIDARVVPVGVDRHQDVAIPADVRTLGWYRYGAAPGDPGGSIVVVGHVDSAAQGLGTFFPLHTVPAHARVVVRTSDGRVWRYQVVGRRQYPKTSVPLGAIFGTTGAPRLTLITCGGAFDAATHNYLANVVVTVVAVER